MSSYLAELGEYLAVFLDVTEADVDVGGVPQPLIFTGRPQPRPELRHLHQLQLLRLSLYMDIWFIRGMAFIQDY